MDYTSKTNLAESYSKLSAIGEFSTLLLIANRCFTKPGDSLLINLLFFESILLYIIYWIISYKKDNDFYNYYFQVFLRNNESKLTLGIYIILFLMSFFLPDSLWTPFQYTIVLSAIPVLLYRTLLKK